MDLHEIVESLIDTNRWPTYRNSTELTRLQELANDAYARGTFDGYLSFVLISHQCCEDFILILIKEAQLALHACLIQHGYGWKPRKDSKLEGKMTGQLLEILERSLEFEGKKEFIEVSKELGQIRNRLAHKLVEGVSLDGIQVLADECRDKNSKLVDLFNDADEAFCGFFIDTIKDRVLDGLVSRRLQEAADVEEIRRWEVLMSRIERHRRENPFLYKDDHL